MHVITTEVVAGFYFVSASVGKTVPDWQSAVHGSSHKSAES